MITLKFLGLFAQQCEFRVEEDDTGWASAVWFDARLFAWDRLTYPQAQLIAFLDGTSLPLLQALGPQLPSVPLVLKTSDPRAKVVVEGSWGHQPLRRFLWYTAPQPVSLGPQPVLEQTKPGWEMEKHLVENGYTLEELGDFQARGARWFGAWSGNQLAAFCMVYPNHGPVWEVAAVQTLPDFRRQGYGAAVVRAAVGWLQSQGHRVRYHVDADNSPSRALAESLGLKLHVEAQHYAFGW